MQPRTRRGKNEFFIIDIDLLRRTSIILFNPGLRADPKVNYVMASEARASEIRV